MLFTQNGEEPLP